MAMSQLGRVAGIDDVDKLNAFHDASTAYVEAGDDAFGQHEEADIRE